MVWHDGELWRVAVDTQSLEEDPKSGKLANFVPLTNYRYVLPRIDNFVLSEFILSG